MAASLSIRVGGTDFISTARKTFLNSVRSTRRLLQPCVCSFTQDTSTGVSAGETAERDPYPVYSSAEVQSLLSRITGFDLVKLAGPQMKPLEKPSYFLLTDEELAEKTSDSEQRLMYRLQMPPFMNPRKPITDNLLEDPDLAGHDTSKFVFADISFGIKDRKRNVVVREPDGSLHVASWDVKERINQIYNPREGRHVVKPIMFEEQYLERMLSEGQYVYILNRACSQFEPDDPDYIRTTRRVYNAVNSSKDYDQLRSTRHFGPMAFYLAWNRMIDDLLLDMINKDLDEDAKDLVHLYSLLHQDSTTTQALKDLANEETCSVIKAYIQSDAEQKLKDQLEMAVQALEDSKKSQSNKGQNVQQGS